VGAYEPSVYDANAHFAHRVRLSSRFETARLNETHLRLADRQRKKGKSLIPARPGRTHIWAARQSDALDGHNGRIVDCRGPAVPGGAQSRERHENTRPQDERSRLNIHVARSHHFSEDRLGVPAGAVTRKVLKFTVVELSDQLEVETIARLHQA